MMYEIYLVPNDELDGTEDCLDENEDKSEAIERAMKSGSIWVIKASDEEGYIKVVAT